MNWRHELEFCSLVRVAPGGVPRQRRSAVVFLWIFCVFCVDLLLTAGLEVHILLDGGEGLPKPRERAARRDAAHYRNMLVAAPLLTGCGEYMNDNNGGS
jgi:hypothetical protein